MPEKFNLGSGLFGIDNPYSSMQSWLPGSQSQGIPMVGNTPAPQSLMDSLGSWFKDSGFLGSEKDGIKTQGWGGMALGTAQGLGNAFLAMQNYGLARDTFNESKDQFNRNFAATQKTTNAALEDRQRARVAANSGAYQSVGDYMQRNGV